jgi:hypothetical protein
VTVRVPLGPTIGPVYGPLAEPGGMPWTRAPSGGAVFSPLDQSPALWLRGDLGVSLVGGAVATWADQSGNGNNYTQSTSANRPTPGTLSGQPCVQFTFASGQQHLLGPSFSALTAAHAFVVVRLAADPSSFAAGLGGFWNFGSGAGADFIPYPPPDNRIYDGFGSTARKTTTATRPNMASDTRVYEVVSAAGEWTNKMDAVQLFTTGTNTVGWRAVSSGLGATVSDLSVRMNGSIAEMLIFPSKRSAAELAQIYAYFNARYGLSL